MHWHTLCHLFVSNLWILLFSVTEKDLLLVTTEKQRKIEEQQKIIATLKLQLRDKDKENETLKQSIKGNWYYYNR